MNPPDPFIPVYNLYTASQFAQATQLWGAAQQLIVQATDDVNPYDVRQRHAPSCNKESTNQLMNNNIRLVGLFVINTLSVKKSRPLLLKF